MRKEHLDEGLGPVALTELAPGRVQEPLVGGAERP